MLSFVQNKSYTNQENHSHAVPNYKGHYLSGRHSASVIDSISEPAQLGQEKPSTKLLLGITTAYDKKSEKLRAALRRTWFNYNSAWRDNIEHKFFVGVSPEGAQISKEELALGDIVFLPFIDTYNNLSLKTMHLCKWATDNYNFDFMLKMDDDTFLRLDKFVDLLIKNSTKTKYYAGKSHPSWKPTRDPAYKWAVSREEFPEEEGPGWVQGFMYALSYDSAKFIGDKVEDPKYPRLHLEDINTSLIMAEFGAKPTQIDDISIHPRCKENLLAMHYSNSTQMYQFYYASMTGDRNMCRDVSLNFET